MKNISIFVIYMLVNSACTVRNTRLRRSTPDVDVQKLEITSNVALRYAKVTVRSLMVNRKSSDQDVAFQMSLPKEAYITSFTIKTNNRTIKAVIKEKKKAKEEYDKAKSDNVTAGLVSQQGVRDDLDVDIFQIEVNVAANTEVQFQLEYEEFLRRHAGKYSQKLYIDSEHMIPNLAVNCSLKEKQKIKSVSFKTPYLQQGMSTENGGTTDDGYYLKTIEWNLLDAGLETDASFEINYDLELDDSGGTLFFNNDGEFVHLFSVPCIENEIMTKQIVFVIDISGSMDGNPILQVRQAMGSILSQLRVNDYFNIIIFDDVAEMWRQRFQQANYANVYAAKLFVHERVKASGSTNINDALLEAITLFDNADVRSGQIIVFLTDGSPTAGETNTAHIRRNVRNRNYIGGEKCCKSTIHTIAFGRYAVISFLTLIAYENAGSITIIKEIENDVADRDLIAMYADIRNPYYKNLVFSFEVDNEILPEKNVTQTKFLQFDCGSEIVISGYTFPGQAVNPTVKVVGVQEDTIFSTVPTILVPRDDAEIVSRLVAYQWVKELLREVVLTTNAGIRKAASEKALQLSLQYGFVTPLTSLVVTDYPTNDKRQLLKSPRKKPRTKNTSPTGAKDKDYVAIESYGIVATSALSNARESDCEKWFFLLNCLVSLFFYI